MLHFFHAWHRLNVVLSYDWFTGWGLCVHADVFRNSYFFLYQCYFSLLFYFQCGRSFDPRFLFTWPTARVAMDTVEDMADVCCGEVRIMYPLYCPPCEP